MTDDEVFIASLRDPEQFGEIMNRYQAPFLRKAKEILKDEDEAYDAVQEAFVRIYSAAKKYRKQEGASFKAWAYKVLVNQCFTLYKKKKRERTFTVQVEEEFAQSFPDQYEIDSYERKLTKEYVLSLVSKLPKLLGKIVTLHFIDEIPQKDIAEKEGISHEVVRARIHRAKKQLREMNIHAI